ncbi:hypothetical protein V8C26DRAFT_281737 [Trichoderma gracile]
MPLDAAGFGFFVGVHAVRHHFRDSYGASASGDLADGRWCCSLANSGLPAFSRALGSSSLGGCCHPSGWGISSASQPVDDGQTQSCSRETVDRLGRLSVDAILVVLLPLGIVKGALPATTTLEVSEIEHALLDAARLQPWSHGFHWTLQKLAEEAISLHDVVGLGGTAPALLEEDTLRGVH